MGAAAEDVVDAAANVNGGMTTTTTTTASTASTAASTTAASSSGASSRYLVVFHAVSAGLNGAALGADEQEIVFIVAVVLDVRDNQIISRFESCVRPSTSADVNENLLSEQVRTDYGLTEDKVKCAPGLDRALSNFDAFLPTSNGGAEHDVTLVTDGPLQLRQCLLPEAQRKGIRLADYFYRFHDLRKEFSSAFPSATAVNSVEDMLNHLGISPASTASSDCEQAVAECINMSAILQKLNCDEVRLHEAEVIETRLEQGILSREDAVDQDCCVRARGLPWQASDQDIARFFVGLNVAKGGVALCLSAQGRRNGEALVLFENAVHREMALKRHKHHIGNRYIEVYKATGEDFINVAGGSNKEAQAFLSRGGQVIIRMRGLPYDCTAKQVTEFFAKSPNDAGASSSANGEDGKSTAEAEAAAAAGEAACSVLEGEDGVLFVRKPDGRATGDAFVLFSEEPDAEKALKKHKDIIGSRYIELFRSTTAEVQQVLNRTMEQHSGRHGMGAGGGGGGGGLSHHHNNPAAVAAAARAALAAQDFAAVAAAAAAANPAAAAAAAAANQLPLMPHLPHHHLGTPPPPQPALPQQMITRGTNRNCIRLRGLPYEANIENILEFLGEHAKKIVHMGVHMVYNVQGQPSDAAFIQMDSEQSAFLASQGRHNRYMIFGKKQHYVEVYQCSGDDMNLVLASAGDPSSATNGNEAPAVTTSTASTVSNSASIAAALMQQHHHHHQQPGMLPTPAPHPQPQVPTSSSSSLTGLDPSLLLNNPYLVQQQQQQQQQNLAAQMQMQMQFPGLANHPGLMQPHLAALAHLPRPGVPQASQGALLQNPYLAQAQQRLILQQQQHQQHQQNAAVQALLARPQFAHFGAGGGGLLPQPLPATATAAAAAQSYAAAAAAAAAGKRSFDQAFTAQPQAGADSLAKRAATYSANHTISANPTTYHTSQ